MISGISSACKLACVCICTCAASMCPCRSCMHACMRAPEHLATDMHSPQAHTYACTRACRACIHMRLPCMHTYALVCQCACKAYIRHPAFTTAASSGLSPPQPTFLSPGTGICFKVSSKIFSVISYTGARMEQRHGGACKWRVEQHAWARKWRAEHHAWACKWRDEHHALACKW